MKGMTESERVEQMIRAAFVAAISNGETEVSFIGIAKRVASEVTAKRTAAAAAAAYGTHATETGAIDQASGEVYSDAEGGF